MDKKNIFIVGGSSGIGLELVRVLNDDYHEIYVGSEPLTHWRRFRAFIILYSI